MEYIAALAALLGISTVATAYIVIAFACFVGWCLWFKFIHLGIQGYKTHSTPYFEIGMAAFFSFLWPMTIPIFIITKIISRD